jgi:branched-chain amino acid aminotransferase
MKQSDYKTSVAYLRNDFLPLDSASLSITSSPILYGLSIYTVLGAHWNRKEEKLYAFRVRDHYSRLVNSAKIMDFHNFVAHWPYERFEAMVLDLLKQNEISQDVLIRITVFVDEELAGTKIHGLKNSVSAFLYPLNGLYPDGGISVCVSSWQRNPDNAIPARAKVNGSYINAALMKNEALLNGFDDAIAVDQSGHVSESTVANVFLVRDGVLVTPDNATDILEGITRDSIVRLAKSLDIPLEQRPVDRSELYIADEVLLCGSSAGIVPITSVDKRPIGTGEPGPVTIKLSDNFQKMLHGELPEFAEWRTEATLT